MNPYWFYETTNGEKIKCRRISQTRIEKMWKVLTNKPIPKIIGIYVSDQKFETIYSDLYYSATQEIRNLIDRERRKEWLFKGQLSMDSGFFVRQTQQNSERYLIVIRSPEYVLKEKGSEILKHELLHVVDEVT